MSDNRAILPAQPAHTTNQSVHTSQRVNFSSTTSESKSLEQNTMKQTRHRHPLQEWEGLKQRFTELYFESDGSLKDVKRIIQQERGFEASIRQYKNKIQEWGLEKHIKASDMEILVAKRDKRARDRGVGTVFIVRGVQLDSDRLVRFSNREVGIVGAGASPSAPTPAHVNYHTPKSPIDVEPASARTNDTFVRETRHHYQTLRPVTTIQVIFEKDFSITKTSIRRRQHAHQGAGHGIAWLGRLVDQTEAKFLLWHAHSLAIDLSNPSPRVRTEASARAPLCFEPSVPHYWVSPHVTPQRSQQLVEAIKHSNFCQNHLGFESQNSPGWLKDWYLMNEGDGSEVEAVGYQLFGEPAAAYPTMDNLTLLIRWSISATRPAFLRICICDDPTQDRRSCEYCHSTSMILDFMDPEGAVKLNIPFSSNSIRGPVSSWEIFSETFLTDTWTGDAIWSEVDYLFQGMTQVHKGCTDHTTRGSTEIHHVDSYDQVVEDDFDPEGNLGSEIFEPFPHLSAWFCPKAKGIIRDKQRAWDPESDPEVLSEELSFEPFPAD